MAIDYVRGGNQRCPNFLLAGLLLICLFLACSWWSLSSQNFELLNQVHGLEEQLKINGEEIDKCLTNQNALEEKSRNLQAGAASARVKLEQLETKEDNLRESMIQQQEELKKKISLLESSVSFKNTELESLKTLGEAKNKTLEALRTEKKRLTARLDEQEAMVKALKQQLSNKLPPNSNLDALLRGDSNAIKSLLNRPEDTGVVLNSNHAAAEKEENNAAEVAEAPVQEPDKEGEGVIPDPREEAMAGQS